MLMHYDMTIRKIAICNENTPLKNMGINIFIEKIVDIYYLSNTINITKTISSMFIRTVKCMEPFIQVC